MSRFSQKDPLHVVIRRKAQGGELRKRMYLGHPPGVPHGRQLTWAALMRDMREPGYFGTQELFDITEAFAYTCHLPRPSHFDQDADLDLLKALEAHLIEIRRAERRWERQYTNAQRAYQRQEDLAKQALLDSLCPWCGTWLPCLDHCIGEVEIDGHGGLREYNRPVPRSQASACSSPAPSAVSRRPESTSGV